MINSLMHVRGGIIATNRIACPMSSTCTIPARRSSDGGIGRLSRIGVATSPGRIEHARIPLRHSSMLIDSVSAISPRLVALYAGPVSFDGLRPAHDDTLIIVLCY